MISLWSNRSTFHVQFGGKWTDLDQHEIIKLLGPWLERGGPLYERLADALEQMFNAGLLSVPFFLAGGLKLVYDYLLLRNFRTIRPPEEQGK